MAQPPQQNGQTQGQGGTIDLRAMGGASGGGQPSQGAATAATSAAAAKFNIPDDIKKKYPDLIPLILETESMNDEERDYWFQILPIMTEEQVAKFRTILLNEKKQLSKLDTEYQKEISKLNEKHLVEWQEFERKEKWASIAKAETQAEQDEAAFEEELLKKLDDA